MPDNQDGVNGFSGEDFGRAFQVFLEHFNKQNHKIDPKNRIASRLQDFMGGDLAEATIITEKFPAFQLPNVHLALENYFDAESREVELLGFATDQDYLTSRGFSALTGELKNSTSDPLMIGPVMRNSVELSEDEHLVCVQAGLYLIQEGDNRLAVFFKGPHARFFFTSDVEMEVMSFDRDLIDTFLKDIRQQVRENNIYRGRTVSIMSSPTESFVVKLHTLPDVKREDIVLPENLLDRIERNSLSFVRFRAQLLVAQRHLRRGLLFHGPPGTGKTLTITYLAQHLENRTTVLINGQQLAYLSQAISFARDMAPALIVMDDVDLIAEERNGSSGSSAFLFDLLNEMDGLAPDEDIIFLLSTNRPDVIEKAVATRPGRIDQAFEFPLPDADARKRLFARYAEGLDLQWESPDEFIRKTDGASPAFIRELLRKAAIFASEETPESEVVPPLKDHHLEAAIKEMVDIGGSLTKSMLGASKLGF